MSIDAPVNAVPLRNEPVLLFGASGLVGAEVLRLASSMTGSVHAVSRTSGRGEGDDGRVRWHRGRDFDLHAGDGPWPAAPTVISAGPLDALAAWLERVRPAALRRLVALGSTSVETKTDSPDPAERALVARLASAESRVIDYCQAHGVRWTVLRPTLIWGRGRDRNVSRLAAMARRFGVIVLPSFASGLRQPIRASDVAAALLAAVTRVAAEQRRLDLPGGEVLPYDEMARRIAQAVAPPGRVIRLPGGPLLAVARGLAAMGIARHAAAAMERTRRSLVFDGAATWQALDRVPEGFVPTADDFNA